MNYAVLQLVTGLGVGGAERVVIENHLRYQNEKCFDSYVCSLVETVDILEQYAKVENVNILGVNKSPLSFFASWLKLLRFVKNKKINVIHAHMFHALVFTLLTKVFYPQTHVVFTSHNFQGFSKFRSFLIRVTKRMRDVDVIFSHNQHTSLNASQSRVIPNGVAVPDCVISRESWSNKLLFIGRLEPQKRPDKLIAILQEFEHLVVDVAGSGSLYSELNALAEKNKVNDRLCLKGNVDDVKANMKDYDALIITSDWEGMPLALLEAGSMGLPVVSPYVGAIGDILTEATGYPVVNEDYSAAIVKLYSDIDMANRKSQAMYQTIACNYSLESQVKNCIEVYTNLMH